MGIAVLPFPLVALGLFLVAKGLWPRPRTLGEAMSFYRQTPALPRIVVVDTEEPPDADHGVQELTLRRVAAALSKSAPSLVRQLVPVSRRADLFVAGRTPERHAAEKVVVALTASFSGAILAGGVLVIGDVPFVAPLWLLVVFGSIGFLLPDYTLRQRARERREEMQDVVTAFVYVVSLSLSAGNGVQTALRHGVARGDGWAWRQLRAALQVVHRTRETEWAALRRLGEELQVSELEELSARARLAQQDGARIHDSLSSFADTLQSRRLMRIEKEAHRNTLQMAVASCVIALGFTLLLGAAAVGGITTG